ncbi:Linoleoyl-CoA desaturase OS=Streptomyces violarus OX=67380 GN=FHS41_007414 PE=4 SV=1 [Streptomyces violarus]
MTAIDPTAHLTAEQIEELGRELDAIRDEVIADRGEKDAAYIRKVISAQRKLELVSRGVLLFSIFPPAWLLGTAGLSVAQGSSGLHRCRTRSPRSRRRTASRSSSRPDSRYRLIFRPYRRHCRVR